MPAFKGKDDSGTGKIINYKDYNKNPKAYGAVSYNNNPDNVKYSDYNKQMNAIDKKDISNQGSKTWNHGS